LGAAGQQSGIHRSDDGGQTWILIDNQHLFGSANRPMVVGDPRVYGRVYFTTGGRGIMYGQPAGTAD
jgi:photosystem II stability/assembly factor-like uncharacterized protein